MAKFCTNCGKPLKEGEECTCKREIKVETGEPKDYINQVLDLFKGLFLKPVDTIRMFAKEENMVFGCCLMVATSIFVGLFGMFFFSKLTTTTVQLFGFGTVSLEFPYFRYFMTFTLSFLIQAVLLVFLADFLANKLFKGTSHWKTIMATLGLISMIPLVTVIIASLVLFLSMKLMFLILITGCLYYSVLFFQGLKETTKVEENRFGQFIALTILIIVLIVGYIIPAIF